MCNVFKDVAISLQEVKLAEGRENVELMDCLNLFLAEKTLSKDDAW